MSSNLTYNYNNLIGKNPREILQAQDTPAIETYLGKFCDENHLVILHALIQECQKNHNTDLLLEPGEKTFQVFQTEFKNAWLDSQKRIEEFVSIWKERFEFEFLYPALKETWVEQQIDGYKLRGKGTKEESRKLFQQTVQDAVVESVRIVSLFLGSMNRIQNRIFRDWQKECLNNNASKIFPVLEESLRENETNIFRKIPEFMTDKFTHLFVDHIHNWEKKVYASEETLFCSVAWKWMYINKSGNGFLGYLYFLLEFMDSLLKMIHQYYGRKWRMYLRGVGVSEKLLAKEK